MYDNYLPRMDVFRDVYKNGLTVRVIKKVNGQMFIAKHNIEWIPCEEYHTLPNDGCSFSVNCFENYEDNAIESKFNQLKEDKKEHISNLNEIIRMIHKGAVE